MALPPEGLSLRTAYFVYLSRWSQYCLEALSVNEVGSGLMIEDTVQGVPISISAIVMMQMVKT